MKIMIELVAGSNHREPSKKDMDKNIEALRRAIDGKPLASDFVLLLDTISILDGIKAKLPRLHRTPEFSRPSVARIGWNDLLAGKQMLRVLIACEFSGTVRRAFNDLGHNAYSCDLLPAEDGSPYHHQTNVLELLTRTQWDLMIAHPPCTHLAVSGARWFKEKQKEQAEALEFVRKLMDAPVPRIAIENPISIISSRIRKPDQIIQPWQFGHPESKATCLWLKGLPKLKPTNILPLPSSGRWDNMTPSGQNKLGPSPDRWKERAKTYSGIAEAMAAQWGDENAKAEMEESSFCGRLFV